MKFLLFFALIRTDEWVMMVKREVKGDLYLSKKKLTKDKEKQIVPVQSRR